MSPIILTKWSVASIPLPSLPHSTEPGKSSTCKQAGNHRILSFKRIIIVISPPFHVSFPFKPLLHKLLGFGPHSDTTELCDLEQINQLPWTSTALGNGDDTTWGDLWTPPDSSVLLLLAGHASTFLHVTAPSFLLSFSFENFKGEEYFIMETGDEKHLTKSNSEQGSSRQ